MGPGSKPRLPGHRCLSKHEGNIRSCPDLTTNPLGLNAVNRPSGVRVGGSRALLQLFTDAEIHLGGTGGRLPTPLGGQPAGSSIHSCPFLWSPFKSHFLMSFQNPLDPLSVLRAEGAGLEGPPVTTQASASPGSGPGTKPGPRVLRNRGFIPYS